jgi:hypothetical protein
MFDGQLLSESGHFRIELYDGARNMATLGHVNIIVSAYLIRNRLIRLISP